MRSSAYRALLVLLAVFSLSQRTAIAQDAPVATPRAAAASGEGSGAEGSGGESAGAAKSTRNDAATAPAGKGAKVSIPWDGETWDQAEVIKRFGRFERNELWDKSERLSMLALATESKELHRLAHWYLARVAARKLHIEQPEDPKELREQAIEHLRKAVELGFGNPQAVSEAKELLPLHGLPEFETLLSTIEKAALARIRGDYAKAIEERLAAAAKLPEQPWRPSMRPLAASGFLPAGIPALVVVSRIHHDGFDKLLPRLKDAVKAHAPGHAVGVLFYQYDLDDKVREDQTRRYVEHLEVSFPVALVSHAEYKLLVGLLQERNAAALVAAGKKAESIDIFQPITVFLKPDGTPLFHASGVLFDWQLELVLKRIVGQAGAEGKTEPAPGQGG